MCSFLYDNTNFHYHTTISKDLPMKTGSGNADFLITLCFDLYSQKICFAFIFTLFESQILSQLHSEDTHVLINQVHFFVVSHTAGFWHFSYRLSQGCYNKHASDIYKKKLNSNKYCELTTFKVISVLLPWSFKYLIPFRYSFWIPSSLMQYEIHEFTYNVRHRYAR